MNDAPVLNETRAVHFVGNLQELFSDAFVDGFCTASKLFEPVTCDSQNGAQSDALF